MNSGSFESLNVSVRCGCKAKARQMRLIVLRLNPHALAIERVLQCVASAGRLSKVRVSTASICASVTVRGAPGRGSSSKPSSAVGQKPHPPPADGLLGNPQLLSHPRVRLPGCAPRISRARWARAWAVLGRRVQRSNVCRSSAVSVTGGVGRPVRMGVLLSLRRTPDAHKLFRSFQSRDTRGRPRADVSGRRHGRSAPRRHKPVHAVIMLVGYRTETINRTGPRRSTRIELGTRRILRNPLHRLDARRALESKGPRCSLPLPFNGEGVTSPCCVPTPTASRSSRAPRCRAASRACPPSGMPP